MESDNIMAEVKVFRFDPQEDKEPRWEVYQTPYEGYTVLLVLRYIYEHLDSSLAFRYGCAGSTDNRCGACLVLLNGRPALSCEAVAEKNMTIGPHPRFEIAKDLIVDFNRTKEEDVPVVGVQIVVDHERCNGCGDCLVICPSGVYEVKKGKANPVESQYCCGMTCKQCATFCYRNAITVT
ncbi:2Fe-2S iron-sulfur cluster-binding protein [Chloroflexota bacterium]